MSPRKTKATKLLKELMEKYNQYRELWIIKYHTDYGFNEWFTKQVNGK